MISALNLKSMYHIKISFWDNPFCIMKITNAIYFNEKFVILVLDKYTEGIGFCYEDDNEEISYINNSMFI